MPKSKTAIIEPLEQNPIIEEKAIIEDIEESDDDIQVSKIIKEKRPRSQKQIDAFAKTILIRQQRRDERSNIKIEEENKKILEKVKEKKILESKIIKKAISIKKKNIIKQQILEDISDDDTDIEYIKEMIQRKKEQKLKDKRINDLPAINNIQPLALLKYKYI
jgi:hypothetical protein